MKVSQEEAQAKITDFTESNILGTVILYALIINLIEPFTLKITDFVKAKVKGVLSRKVSLSTFKK